MGVYVGVRERGIRMNYSFRPFVCGCVCGCERQRDTDKLFI